MEITIEEIQKKFESLPEDLRWAIMAADVDNKIIDICKLNNLTVEQMGQLSLETHMVMFGFTHPDKFEASVQASLKLDPNKTRVLVNAINERILKEIRSKIMALHGEKEKEKKEKDSERGTTDHEEIFRNAGIEVVESNSPPDSPRSSYGEAGKGEEKGVVQTGVQNLEMPELMAPKAEGVLKKPDSIIMQKLSGAIQMPKVTTEYSTNPASPSATNPVAKPTVDPYRMPIE